MRRAGVVAVALALAATAGACRPRLEPEPEVPPATLVRVAQPPAFGDDGEREDLALAIRRSLAYYATRPAEEPLHFGSETVTVAAMRAGLEAVLPLLTAPTDDGAWLDELTRRFTVYRAPAPGGALFTAYYVPTLEARPRADGEFRYPIFGRPPDLVTLAPELTSNVNCRSDIVGRVEHGRLVPYYTRAEIEGGAVPHAPILAWARDPVDLFFLHIQGSGTLALPGGVQQTIGFAATNGRPYVSIGTLLLERGELAPGQASQANIRAWVAAAPAERTPLLHQNPRFVFFRPMSTPPEGSLGVPVTAGRSIATDQALYPPGALAFVRLPGSGDAPGLARLVLNQDSGGAIRGPGRVDLFFGAGDEAGRAAGRVKTRGELYFLAPRAGPAS
jgi:membrane-bound lytic murein transglycosylase A